MLNPTMDLFCGTYDLEILNRSGQRDSLPKRRASENTIEEMALIDRVILFGHIFIVLSRVSAEPCLLRGKNALSGRFTSLSE